jgi:hypothetical protein
MAIAASSFDAPNVQRSAARVFAGPLERIVRLELWITRDALALAVTRVSTMIFFGHYA